MKIWVDDVREAPAGYVWCKSVNETISLIEKLIKQFEYESDFSRYVEIIDLDHDAGDFFRYGGDYINVLNYLERENIRVPVRIHSMNIVGKMNMLAICERNNWIVVL